MRYRFTQHAMDEMAKRGVTAAEIDAVIQSPEQTFPGEGGRTIRQSKVRGGYLILRVILDERSDPAMVVTLYLTSKIAKYWRS
jgi:hypothetical protein